MHMRVQNRGHKEPQKHKRRHRLPRRLSSRIFISLPVRRTAALDRRADMVENAAQLLRALPARGPDRLPERTAPDAEAADAALDVAHVHVPAPPQRVDLDGDALGAEPAHDGPEGGFEEVGAELGHEEFHCFCEGGVSAEERIGVRVCVKPG